MIVGDDGAYEDDEGDDDINGLSGDGSGHHDNDMMPRARYHHPMLPSSPVDRHFINPSTRRRPVMYTAASAVGPVIYTTPGHVYFTRRTNYVVGNTASLSSVASIMYCVVILIMCSCNIRFSLSAVS